MSFDFRPAKREEITLLIGLVGGTGSGKTYTGMTLASGMAGDDPFAVIDSENGRAKHYADEFKFDHCNLAPPFTPENYLAAIQAADKLGYKVIMVDTTSHVWAGDGGVLDMQEAALERMAGSDYKKREACKMASWIQPKLSHKAFVNGLLRVKAHVILCFRAEEKIEMVKEDGKMKIVPKKTLVGRDGWVPVCDKNLPYELTCSFLFTADQPGVPQPIKLEHKHRSLFPSGQQITANSGKFIAEWAKGGVQTSAQKPSAPTALDGRLSEKQIADFDASIDGASTLEELAKAFTKAYRAARDLGDQASMSAFERTKDRVKNKLEATV